MTAVLNGSTIIQNRSGVTIDTYPANGNNVSGSTTTIGRSAGWTVAVLQPQSANDYACNIPAGFEVGDVIEFYLDTTVFGIGGGWFYLPAGETMPDGVSDRGGIGPGTIMRKISSTMWGRLP
jgi:hypothetical protein